MKRSEMEKIVKKQFDACEKLLLSKSDEYTEDNEDKLAAFKRAGALLGTTPQDALIGMLVKHLTSVAGMCKSGKEYPEELWSEKITDTINYMLLLRAVVTEGQKTEKPEAPKKRGPKPGPKPLDGGKLVALYNAGWPVSEIADEMQVPEQTVRNHLARLKEKQKAKKEEEEKK